MGKENHGDVQITGSRGKVTSEINRLDLGVKSHQQLIDCNGTFFRTKSFESNAHNNYYNSQVLSLINRSTVNVKVLIHSLKCCTNRIKRLEFTLKPIVQKTRS